MEDLETTFEQNRGLIWHIINNKFNEPRNKEDLFQIGCIAFIKAYYYYEKDRGATFCTYASKAIYLDILAYLYKQYPLGRYPKKKGMQIFKFEESFLSENERCPTQEEICKEYNISIKQYTLIQGASKTPYSLDENVVVGEEAYTYKDNLPDKIPNYDINDILCLHEELQNLSNLEKKIIYLRFEKGLLQREIAEFLSINQSYVTRIEKRSIKKLRKAMGVMA